MWRPPCLLKVTSLQAIATVTSQLNNMGQKVQDSKRFTIAHEDLRYFSRNVFYYSEAVLEISTAARFHWPIATWEKWYLTVDYRFFLCYYWQSHVPFTLAANCDAMVVQIERHQCRYFPKFSLKWAPLCNELCLTLLFFHWHVHTSVKS